MDIVATFHQKVYQFFFISQQLLIRKNSRLQITAHYTPKLPVWVRRWRSFPFHTARPCFTDNPLRNLGQAAASNACHPAGFVPWCQTEVATQCKFLRRLAAKHKGHSMASTTAAPRRVILAHRIQHRDQFEGYCARTCSLHCSDIKTNHRDKRYIPFNANKKKRKRNNIFIYFS